MFGVHRAGGVGDRGMLEFAIREDLDANAARAMCVLKPLKVVITNYPEGKVENLELPRHPKQDLGVRVLPFSREIYIDASDFEETPPDGFKRMVRSEEHTSELQSLMRNSYAVFCLK